MIWTYRVFRDSQGRYSLREVFYERDGRIINYGKSPVVMVGSSLEEMMQLVVSFKEALDLPVLSVDEVDAQIAEQPVRMTSKSEKRIPLKDVIAGLSAENEQINTV